MRQKRTSLPTKGRKAKAKEVQPSDATIARREKKARVAQEQLELLEKHKDDLAEMETLFRV